MLFITCPLTTKLKTAFEAKSKTAFFYVLIKGSQLAHSDKIKYYGFKLMISSFL